MSGPGHNARISAAMGAVVWLGFLFVRTSNSNETELINKILLSGVLVIVPLALSLAPIEQSEENSLLYRGAILAQPIGALAAAISFLLYSGPPAAILSGSWLLITLVIAAFGLRRLAGRGAELSREMFVDAGMLYLPVGGVWLVISRLGIQPLGFGETIVLLTAMHFHFAGFAAPILAGLAGRALPDTLTRVFALAGGCIVGSIPLVAAGITFSPVLALVGALIISLGLILLAVLVLGWILRTVDSFAAQTLLVVSSLSSVCAMVLACLYAYSIVAKTVIVDIPQMAMTHGILNSFGFALCGLLGWSIASPSRRREEVR